MNANPFLAQAAALADAALNAVERQLKPPAWVVDETQTRIVLLLNHVLQQEPQALARLQRVSGRQVSIQWRTFELSLVATPVGLLDRPTSLGLPSKPDLTLTVTQHSLAALAEAGLGGKPPDMRIEGDIQLAAEVGWLTQHVRWDLEEDLSRILGDTAAHQLANVGRAAAAAVRRFAGGVEPSTPGEGVTPAASSPVRDYPDAFTPPATAKKAAA